MKNTIQSFEWSGILRRMLDPVAIPTLLRKALLRIKHAVRPPVSGKDWARERSVDLDAVMDSIDAALWNEAKEVGLRIDAEARANLAQYPYDLGGGGCYPLLYFLARKLRPNVVVETGVAAGFSSYALLLALDANGSGALYSSDFPYFRLNDPQQYIGVLVPERLKTGGRWHLYTDGDRRNIPKILAAVSCVDLIHYDSDKSYAERKWVTDRLVEKAAGDAVVVMDDIQDDRYFSDFVRMRRSSHVFEFEGKYLGVTGLDRLIASAREAQ